MNENAHMEAQKLPPLPSAVLTLSLLFFTVYTACTDIVFYRFAAIIVFFLLVFFMTRSRLMTVLAAFGCFSALLTSASEGVSALFLVYIAIIAFGGFAISFVSPVWWLPVPFLSAGVIVLATGELSSSLAVLLCLPPAAALGIAFKKRMTRTATMALVAATILITLLTALLLSVLIHYGSISGSFLGDFINELRTGLIDSVIAGYETVADDPAYKVLAPLFDRDVLTAAFNATLRLLPAILVISAELIAYFAGLLAVSTCGLLLPPETLPQHAIGFRVNPATAGVFLASGLASSLLGLLGGDTASILTLAATNLFLILLPPLFLCGLITSYVRRKKAPSPFFAILLIVFCFINPIVLIAIVYLYAILGAVRLLIAAYRKYKKEKENNNDTF